MNRRHTGTTHHSPLTTHRTAEHGPTNVLVTGGTGFLGRRLVRRLLEAGCRVRCLVRPQSDIASLRDFVGDAHWPAVEVQRVNLMDVEACRRALAGCDVVYHLAAALSGSPSALTLSTVLSTRRLLEAVSATDVRRVVLVSSLGVYDTSPLRRGDVLDEDCRLEPRPFERDPYTASKVVQEQVAWQAHGERGVPLVIVRPGVIFGPERGCLSARVGLTVGDLLVRMGSRRPLPYTFVENCAAAVLRAGVTAGIEGEAFNVVDDHLPTGREILNGYRRAGKRVRTIGVPQWAIGPLSGLYERYQRWSRGQLPRVITRYRSDALWKPLRYSNAKAKSALGWQPEIGWDEAFRSSIDQL